MSVKQQLIEQVVQLLVDGAGTRLYGPASRTVDATDRKFLESVSVELLEKMLIQFKNEQIRIAALNSPEVQQVQEARRREQEEFLRDSEWSKIFRTPLPGGKVAVDNAANRHIIESWLHPHETLSQAVFVKAIADTPRLIGQLVVTSADSLDPKKQVAAQKQQLEADKKVFEDAAKRLELYSINEANWSVIHSILGPGLSEYQIREAVASGAVRLTPATPSEVQQWRQELAEQRQDWLVNASPAELRAAANAEAEQRRVAAAKQQADEQLEAAVVRDSVMGFPPLPEDWRGQKLDANFIRVCDVATQKLLMKRFGSAQLDLRLRGVK